MQAEGHRFDPDTLRFEQTGPRRILRGRGPLAFPRAPECFFTGPYFAGWAQPGAREASNAGPYSDVLKTWRFMPQPVGTPIDPPGCDPYAKMC